MSESLADRLRRYRREIKEKDPEQYQKMLDRGRLTDQDVVATINKLEVIEQQQEEK
jgi:hypothetical protein